jgi:hypothetical protein
MPLTRRIYVSLPIDHWLSPPINDLKWAIVDEIEKLGYIPEIFINPAASLALPLRGLGAARDADEVARRPPRPSSARSTSLCFQRELIDGTRAMLGIAITSTDLES